MLYPSINDLRDKVDSKYTLVALAAKRSRDLIDGKPALVDITIDKPVSIATEEIAEDLITYRRSRELEALIDSVSKEENADESAIETEMTEDTDAEATMADEI